MCTESLDGASAHTCAHAAICQRLNHDEHVRGPAATQACHCSQQLLIHLPTVDCQEADTDKFKNLRSSDIPVAQFWEMLDHRFCANNHAIKEHQDEESLTPLTV
jgi:hypothetical protein